jgi:hypothetical protein
MVALIDLAEPLNAICTTSGPKARCLPAAVREAALLLGGAFCNDCGVFTTREEVVLARAGRFRTVAILAPAPNGWWALETERRRFLQPRRYPARSRRDFCGPILSPPCPRRRAGTSGRLRNVLAQMETARAPQLALF